jgi:hypothetical protein
MDKEIVLTLAEETAIQELVAARSPYTITSDIKLRLQAINEVVAARTTTG